MNQDDDTKTIIEDKDEFDLVLKPNSVGQVVTIKLSQNNTYVGITTLTGFRIFQFDQMNRETLIVREGQDFILYKQQSDNDIDEPTSAKKFIKDFDFMGDSLMLVFSIERRGIILWDETAGLIMNEFDFACPDQIAYCYPYIFASLGSSVILFNTVQQTLFKYLINCHPLQQNLSFSPTDYHKKRNFYFVHNKDPNNLTLSYSYEGALIVENLSRELVVGIELNDLIQSKNERILEIQEKQLNLLDNQISLKVLEVIEKAKPIWQTVFVTLHQNEIAISKYENQQTIKVFQINWVSCKLELIRDLYRGGIPKEVSIHFGPKGVMASLSIQSQNKNGLYDATLHLYYPQTMNGQQLSNRRYYFKTWTKYDSPHDRLMDTLFSFRNTDSFRIISINDFYLFQEFDLSNPSAIIVPIKDQQKISWQNKITTN